MKKKTKAAPKKKVAAQKAAPKKVAPKKVVKATPKKVVKTLVPAKAGKAAPAKKPTPKKAAKVATKVATKAIPKKAAPAKASTPKKVSAPSNKAVVTTVLPAKLSGQKVSSSSMPAQAAVKAAKPAQAKIAPGVAVETSTRKRLNKEELKFFEALLNEKKETLMQELEYIEDNSMRLNSKEGAGDLSSHAYHLADHATETQDREQAFHLASREGRFLYYIEEALDRVRAGTFGICKKCGTLIPKARLEAVPTAKMCINCKSRQEHAIEGESIL